MIRLNDISYSIGRRVLFEGVRWVIAPGDRVALIGPNGAGKTTLIRVALGELTADSGTRVLSRGTRLGYLPQEAAESFEGTVLDRAMEAHRSLLNMREELDALHQQMETIRPDDPELETILERAGELQSHLELLDEHSLEPEARRILSGLGFPTEDQDRPLAEFSGGWRMRAALAALLLADPTVLFLDEPTNHLDLPAMEWLEDYLVDFHGGLVVVSHDRVFLDRVTTGIRELEHGLTDYPMKFSEYLDEKERRREQAEAHNVQVELKVAQLNRFVERFGAKNTKATQAQSKRKQIGKLLETRKVIPRKSRTISIRFPEPPHAGRMLVNLKDADVGYGEKTVVSGINLTFEKGSKVAIVGANGAGKTTLLKLLAGQLPLQGGERHVFDLTRMAWFAQHAAETLDRSMTILEAVEEVAPEAWRPRLRSLLGSFLFSGDDAFKTCGILSGGERQRVALARILVTPANLLLLDEPTHHLDMAGKQVLEESLEQYPGAVIVVTHDRSLMARLATRVVEVNDGKAVVYPGGYEDYEAARLARKVEAERVPERVSVGVADGGKAAEQLASGRGATSSSARRSRNRSDPGAAKKAAKLTQLEREIETRETRLRTVELEMADPAVYSQGTRIKELVAEHRGLLDELESLWRQLDGL